MQNQNQYQNFQDEPEYSQGLPVPIGQPVHFEMQPRLPQPYFQQPPPPLNPYHQQQPQFPPQMQPPHQQPFHMNPNQMPIAIQL